ncbi:hypothetical protein HK097_004547 [Rhizophlyctis rosea]|uniref:Peptidase M20 dimerisation domain-containing protein n=1 Tax=Rhizophlyctis rosea TaxID=64517 RepID=A0AAD5S2X6_9FUNG|nr:hypothetical protein HK097_004547 [Rhizophlyctis rosea]
MSDIKNHPLLSISRETHQTKQRRWVSTVATAITSLFLITLVCHSSFSTFPLLSTNVSLKTCEQPSATAPETRADLTQNYNKIFNQPGPFHDAFRKAAAERLSEAIQINTVSYDFLRNKTPLPDGVPEPSREGILKFHDFLESRFPKTHATLQREVINRYPLLYTWKGSDQSLEPILFMSHIDTVPVPNATLDQWSHPPFSGHIDEQYVWGRGSVDTKSTLLAILEAVELLVTLDFQPKRTVYLAFGSDEEISGHQGAKFLAQTLLSRGLKNRIAFLIDEGPGLSTSPSLTLAEIGTQEKGYTDVRISISTPGGHSSIPPDHTSIGVLAEIISAIENNQYTSELGDENPLLESLRCRAVWDEGMDRWLRRAVLDIGRWRRKVVNRLSGDLWMRYMMQTSQAVDLIEGGVKGWFLFGMYLRHNITE